MSQHRLSIVPQSGVCETSKVEYEASHCDLSPDTPW